MRARDDEFLLRQYAEKSDEAAFRELVLRYGGLVYSICLHEVRRPDLAEDTVQSVFLDLARKAKRIRVQSSLVPWIYTAARLASKNALRADRRRQRNEAPLNETLVAPALTSDDALFQALDILRAPEREAIVLRFIQGMSLAEVGQIQGSSEDAARMRIQRALKRLRVEFVPSAVPPARFLEHLATIAPPSPLPMMNTPLFIATGGVAAVAVVGTIAAANRKAAHLQTLTEIPVATPAQTPVSKPSGVLAKSPKIQAKKEPPFTALDKPFTLVYRVTVSNLRTPAMNEALIAAHKKELDAAVDADKITQAQADMNLAKTRSDAYAPPWTEEMTLSYDGRILLYEEETGTKDDSNSHVDLFDGKDTYHFLTGNGSPGSVQPSGTMEPGTLQHWTYNMPYVGPSIPLFPLAQGSNRLNLRAYDDKPAYGPYVKLEQEPTGSVRKVQIGPGCEVDLSNWTSVESVSVARRIVTILRDYAADSVNRGAPSQRLQYDLLSATSSATDADRFDPDHYVSTGDTFVLGPNQNRDTMMTVDRSKGTLQQQIAAFRAGKQ